MQPALSAADVRRIVREELRAMGFGEGRLRELVSEELGHALRRLDERQRWMESGRQHEPPGPPGEPSIDWSGRSSSTTNS